MTDNLPDIDKRLETRLPVIVCPFCGEKDPHKLALSSVDREFNLEDVTPWTWVGHDALVPEPTHKNSKITINGECLSCFTTFEIIISARTPYK